MRVKYRSHLMGAVVTQSIFLSSFSKYCTSSYIARTVTHICKIIYLIILHNSDGPTYYAPHYPTIMVITHPLMYAALYKVLAVLNLDWPCLLVSNCMSVPSHVQQNIFLLI